MPTIPAKDAIEIAQRALGEFLPGAMSVRLEEIELVDESPIAWHVTISFVDMNRDEPRSAGLSDLAALLGKQGLREYKQFVVDATNGNVRAMRIRRV